MTQKRDPERTRQVLLEAAFDEMYRHGYQAASLDNILAATGVTKGALYHHFKNKKALGYAVVDEILGAFVRERWLDPLLAAEDPIEAMVEILDHVESDYADQACDCGCPINNLAQEMSPLDEGFRQRIYHLLEMWRHGVANALRQAQLRGTVRDDFDPDQIATFLLATWEGTVGLAKNAQSPEIFAHTREGVRRFLETLRVPQEAPAA